MILCVVVTYKFIMFLMHPSPPWYLPWVWQWEEGIAVSSCIDWSQPAAVASHPSAQDWSERELRWHQLWSRKGAILQNWLWWSWWSLFAGVLCHFVQTLTPYEFKPSFGHNCALPVLRAVHRMSNCCMKTNTRRVVTAKWVPKINANGLYAESSFLMLIAHFSVVALPWSDCDSSTQDFLF